MDSAFSSGKGTFKPIRRHVEGSKRQHLHNYTRKTLGMGYIRQAVELPAGESLSDWLATNVIDFYNGLSLLVGIVVDESLPKMEPGNGFPHGFEYLWVNSDNQTVKCSGPEYIEFVLAWMDRLITNDSKFPSSVEARYPDDFDSTIRTIFKRLFRIYAILYAHFYQPLEMVGAAAHLNTSFKHFLFFAFQFDLLPKAELEAVENEVDRLLKDFVGQGGTVPASIARASAAGNISGTEMRPR